MDCSSKEYEWVSIPTDIRVYVKGEGRNQECLILSFDVEFENLENFCRWEGSPYIDANTNEIGVMQKL